MATFDTKTIRIDYEEFDTYFKKLTTYFNFNKKMTPDIADQYHLRVRFYPVEAFRAAINKHIDENRPTASNFPTPRELANGCAVYVRSRPLLLHQLMAYNEIDDPEFPIEYMHKGFEILMSKGEPAFRHYAKVMRFPLNDIDRVIAKKQAVMARELNEERLEKTLQNIGSKVND